MSKLMEPSPSFRPFLFPWANEAWDQHDQVFWTKHEVPMGDDVTDWKNGKLTSGEKAFVTQILRLFTQADTAVGGYYHEILIPKFQNNEIRNMLVGFAGREITHQHSYALLNDTLGLPEGEYLAFTRYKEMADKADFMMQADNSTKSGLALALAKGVFNEGVSLFASFVMLLNFQRRGLMKGMGKIVEFSIRDEGLHVAGVSKLFQEYCKENPRIVTDAFKRKIYDMARMCVQLEDAFVDSAFALAGEIEGLTAAETKQYIRYIADRRLNQLGLKDNFMVEKNPLPWLDWVTAGVSHQNFFEGKSSDYAVAGLQGEWSYPDRSTTFHLYTRDGCPYCVKAKELLTLQGYEFTTSDLTDDATRASFYEQLGFFGDQRTMPKVYAYAADDVDFENGELVGGYTELAARLGAA